VNRCLRFTSLRSRLGYSLAWATSTGLREKPVSRDLGGPAAGSRGSVFAFRSVLFWLSWGRSTRRDASSNASSLHLRANRDAADYSLPPALLANSAMAGSCDLVHIPYADFGAVEISLGAVGSAVRRPPDNRAVPGSNLPGRRENRRPFLVSKTAVRP